MLGKVDGKPFLGLPGYPLAAQTGSQGICRSPAGIMGISASTPLSFAGTTGTATCLKYRI